MYHQTHTKYDVKYFSTISSVHDAVKAFVFKFRDIIGRSGNHVDASKVVSNILQHPAVQWLEHGQSSQDICLIRTYLCVLKERKIYLLEFLITQRRRGKISFSIFVFQYFVTSYLLDNNRILC